PELLTLGLSIAGRFKVRGWPCDFVAGSTDDCSLRVKQTRRTVFAIARLCAGRMVNHITAKICRDAKTAAQNARGALVDEGIPETCSAGSKSASSSSKRWAVRGTTSLA